MGPGKWQLDDTIVALATAPGSGARAMVRVSGPGALTVVASVFSPNVRDGRPAGVRTNPDAPGSSATPKRVFVEGQVRLADLPPLPAGLYCWPGPASYTGQDVAELHVLSSPPLVERLVTALLGAGARAARPGEFTLRAFLAGKLDLTRAEAVLGVIEAGDRGELVHALKQLAGGVGRPMQELRDDLLSLLADVEAGLDFADEDLRFADARELLLRIGKGLALLVTLQRQLRDRSLSNRPFRAVLAGPPNAGKSSLFNAVAGATALVSPEPGTTRDYLVQSLDLGGVTVELVDTAGRHDAFDAIEQQAQDLGRQQAEQADLVLWCVAPGEPAVPHAANVVTIATKCDLGAARDDVLATSAVTGAGLDSLRALLADRARGRRQPALAPSLSRCAHHVDACLVNLRRAHALVLEDDPPELLALELREALEQLGAMVGAVYTEDLLDRIFSRFCIGK
jgi:tRNA modification GTPase